MNLEGLTEKRRGVTSLWYENNKGEIVAKRCASCEVSKHIDDYYKSNDGSVGGRKSICKDCDLSRRRIRYEKESDKELERSRKYYSVNKEEIRSCHKKWHYDNREKVSERKRVYREKNPEKVREMHSMWERNNPEKRRLLYQRYQARKSALPNDLTHEQYSETLEYFGNACALTGRTYSIEIEHAVPLNIGHGGTTHGNCYPMTKSLNASKYNRNIFEWFEANRQRFELSQERFNKLIAWLASANAMTVEEYRNYVYWCHANPRSIDELEAN